MKLDCQVLVVGAGIIGLTMARELISRGAEDVLILEKEEAPGCHASGRNSGVLHSGVYYSPDTLKARFCVRGNRLMKEYCRERGLTLLETGKAVVARGPEEANLVEELARQARAAGVEVRLIDDRELREIEPHAFTWGKALHCPETAVVQPLEILRSLERELLSSGKARFLYRTRVEGFRSPIEARTSRGPIRFRYLINAGGAFADRLAHSLGLGREFRILPFKGTYWRLAPSRKDLVQGNIYPVPDLRYPFLGLHFTRTAAGEVYLGPGVTPAWGRENYRAFKGMGRDTFPIAAHLVALLLADPGFRLLALREKGKLSPHHLWREAASLVPSLRPEDLEPSSKVGIRPQLFSLTRRQLVTDFVVLKEEHHLHVLNAISPAFTSSLAFAAYAVDLLEGPKNHPLLNAEEQKNDN